MNRLEPLVYIVLKLTVCVFVECVTNIVLLSQTTHQSCIENFFALQTLLNIDQFFYNVLPLTDKLALVAEKQLRFTNFVKPKIGVKVIKPAPV